MANILAHLFNKAAPRVGRSAFNLFRDDWIKQQLALDPKFKCLQHWGECRLAFCALPPIEKQAYVDQAAARRDVVDSHRALGRGDVAMAAKPGATCYACYIFSYVQVVEVRLFVLGLISVVLVPFSKPCQNLLKRLC